MFCSETTGIKAYWMPSEHVGTLWIHMSTTKECRCRSHLSDATPGEPSPRNFEPIMQVFLSELQSMFGYLTPQWTKSWILVCSMLCSQNHTGIGCCLNMSRLQTAFYGITCQQQRNVVPTNLGSIAFGSLNIVSLQAQLLKDQKLRMYGP